MNGSTSRAAPAIKTASSNPGTSGAWSAMKSPAGWKMGKNRAWGDPAPISVSTGTMSVSSLLIPEKPTISPPRASKAVEKLWASPWV